MFLQLSVNSSQSHLAQASYILFKCMYRHDRYSDEMLENERMVNLSLFLYTSHMNMYIPEEIFMKLTVMSGKCTNICINSNRINRHQMFPSKFSMNTVQIFRQEALTLKLIMSDTVNVTALNCIFPWDCKIYMHV